VQKKSGPESASKSNPVVQQKQSGVEMSNGKGSSEKEEPGVFDRVLTVGLGGTAGVIEKIPIGCFVPVPGFEFMQNFFKGMMVGSLERLSQEKAAHLWRIIQNVFKAVNSVEYMKAYFWGFLKGFFGDFILIWELPGIAKSTADFIGNLVTQIKEFSKEDYEAFTGRIEEIKALVVESGKEYIDSIMRDIQAGKASGLIIEILQTMADFSQETGKIVGGYVTGTMLEYFSKEYKELGKELGGLMGEVSGTIAFTALLAAITSGAGAAWGGVRAGIKTVTEIIGKGVGRAVKAIGTTLKNISKIFGAFIDGVRAVIKGFGKGASKLFKGIKGKLDDVLVKVKQLVDDLLERLIKKRPNSPEPAKQVLSIKLPGMVKAKNIVSRKADEVNKWWSSVKGYKEPPYRPASTVFEFELDEATKFVRVYDEVNSQMRGQWFMKAEDIVGLTPKQIQNKFALPTAPKYIVDLKLPAGSKIRAGEANSLFGFEGKGVQFDMIGQYIGEWVNPRLLQ
jgi:hypothetical protein